MDEQINKIRINNFLRLVEKYFGGSLDEFGKRFALSPTPYRIILAGDRPFSSRASKTVEFCFGLQPGQLDLDSQKF